MKNSKITRWILSLLGFSSVATSCEVIAESTGGGMVCMYGTPTADYVFNIEVVDDQTGEPVPMILTSAYEGGYKEDYQLDSRLTNEQGKATLTFQEFPSGSHTIVTEDIDGPDNGGDYQKTSTTITTNSDDFVEPNGAWYSGTATHDITIRLMKKAEINEQEVQE